jgi:hypothetical protein
MKFILFLMNLLVCYVLNRKNKIKNYSKEIKSNQYILSSGFDIRYVGYNNLYVSKKKIFDINMKDIEIKDLNFKHLSGNNRIISTNFEYKNEFGFGVNIGGEFMDAALSANADYKSTNVEQFSKKHTVSLKIDEYMKNEIDANEFKINEEFKNDVNIYIGKTGDLIETKTFNMIRDIDKKIFMNKRKYFENDPKKCEEDRMYCISIFFDKYGTHYVKKFKTGYLKICRKNSEDDNKSIDKSKSTKIGGEISYIAKIGVNYNSDVSDSAKIYDSTENYECYMNGSEETQIPFRFEVIPITKLLKTMGIRLKLSGDMYCILGGYFCNDEDKNTVLVDLITSETPNCPTSYSPVVPLMVPGETEVGNFNIRNGIIDFDKIFLCQKLETLSKESMKNKAIVNISIKATDDNGECIKLPNKKFICFERLEITRMSTMLNHSVGDLKASKTSINSNGNVLSTIKISINTIKDCSKSYTHNFYSNFECLFSSIDKKNHSLCFENIKNPKK